MKKSLTTIATLMLLGNQAYAADPVIPEIVPDTPEFMQCMKTVYPGTENLIKTADGYQMKSPSLGILFAKSATCESGKAILNGVVMIGDTLKAGQAIGSAMKADVLTVWAPSRREGCAFPVDYGFDIQNFRWFNWNDNATDGGNKRFEIIRGMDGDELRISTMSHLRLGSMIWAPQPEKATSPCAVSGKFEVTNLDTRWSRNGTANGYLADSFAGEVSLPVLLDDARQSTDLANFMVAGMGVSMTDITETQVLRTRRVTATGQMSQASTVPWAFLINKYARDLIYRQEDDTLLLRILPLDLANTFHFTTGSLRASLPEATIIPGAFLPGNLSLDLGAINMSSLFSGAEIAVALRGDQEGTFKMNARADGIGTLKADVDFKTQLFGKDFLTAASKGNVNLTGKTGPGIVKMDLNFEDGGFSQAFLSLMKSKPSTFVIRNATSNMDVWQKVSSWLTAAEGGQPSNLSVTLASPQLMIDGFWSRAPSGAIVRITEGQ